MVNILFWECLILYQSFISPKVKQNVIISNRHGIYELPHELPNDFKLRKRPENLKISQDYSLVPSLPAKTNVVFDRSKKLLKNSN